MVWRIFRELGGGGRGKGGGTLLKRKRVCKTLDTNGCEPYCVGEVRMRVCDGTKRAMVCFFKFSPRFFWLEEEEVSLLII